MISPWLVSLGGGAGFAMAGIAVYLRLRRRVSWVMPVSRVAAVLAVILNAAYVAYTLHAEGMVNTFRQSDASVIVLVTLVGLVGVGTSLSSTLRGLDGFLFVVAALMDFGAMLVINEPAPEVTYRRWFISHGLAFALSSACFVASGAAGVAYLLVHRVLHRKRALSLVGSVPSLEALERFGRWMLALGFPLLTYGILTGIHGVAHRPDLGRTAWYLDGSVLVSLMVWLVYAYGLWALIFRPQVRGRKAAALAACGMGLVVIALAVSELSSPIHQ